MTDAIIYVYSSEINVFSSSPCQFKAFLSILSKLFSSARRKSKFEERRTAIKRSSEVGSINKSDKFRTPDNAT